MGGDGILLLLLGVLSLRNGGGTGLLGSFASYMFSAYALIWIFGRLSSNGKGFVCYCFARTAVKEDA